MGKGKKPTIYDVASDVLNRREQVSAETAGRVQTVIADLGYRPRPNRRRAANVERRESGLSTSSMQVALLVPDIDPRAARTTQMTEIAAGASAYLGPAGHELIIVTLREGGRPPMCLERGQVDGVILRSGELGAALRAALETVPVVGVFWSLDLPGADAVMPDDEGIGRMAAEVLLARGCRRVAALNPQREHPAFCTRSEAFRVAALAGGAEAAVHAIAEQESLRTILPRVRQWGGTDVGIFVPGYTRFNGDRDVAAILEEEGIETARKGRLVGVTAADVPHPHITIRPDRLGRVAAEQLVWRAAHRDSEARRILVAPELIGGGRLTAAYLDGHARGLGTPYSGVSPSRYADGVTPGYTGMRFDVRYPGTWLWPF
jgi:DNA-binding LacI/PurR family transcriptional regulator